MSHRGILGSVAWFSDQTLPMIREDHRKPLAHYGAIKGALARGLLPELHHQPGRDRHLDQNAVFLILVV